MRYISSARASALAVFLHLASGIAAAQQGLLLYVPNAGDTNVSVFRTNADGTLTVVTTIAGTGTQPFSVAVRGDQAFAYVASTITDELRVIDTATNTFTTLSGFSRPEFAAITPNGTTVYVSNRTGDRVDIFTADPITGQLTNTGTPITFVANTRPRGLAVTPDGTRLVVGNIGSVVVYDITNPTSPVSLGGPATATGDHRNVVVNPAGTLAYAVDASGNALRIIDIANPTAVIAPIATGGSARGVAVSADGSRLYVGVISASQVEVRDAATGTLLQSLGISQPHGVVLSRDGQFVYVTSPGLDVVALFSVAPGTGLLTAVPGTFATGSLPAYAGLCANGNRLLAAGNTFVANTAQALACTLPAVPTFTGGTLRVTAAALNFTSAMSLSGLATIDTKGNTATISGVLSGSGTFVKTGTGTLTLSAANTYSGPGTTISTGTLQVGIANALPVATAVTVAAGATLDVNGFAQTVSSLLGTGAVTLGTGSLTVSSNATTTFPGAISGTGGLTKTGSGTLTLSGTSSYTGGTTVNNGGLTVTGTLTSPVTVGSGATLNGTGTITQAVNVGGSAFLSPGVAGPGMLSTGNLNLASNSLLSLQLNGPTAATQYDQVRVTGTVSLGGANLSPALGFTPAPGQVFTIIDNDGADAVSGTFAFMAEGQVIILGAGALRVSYVGGDGNDVTLTVVTVPGAPTITSATPGNGSATITFTPPASNGGAPIDGYGVTCNPGGATFVGTASPITATGLTNGTTYSCTVTAVNGVGAGPASAPVSVTPITVAGAPVIGTATAGSGQATISFTGPGSIGGSPITGYTVTCNPGAIGMSGAGSPITVTGLTNGTTYSCTVIATNGAGSSPPSAAASVTPLGVPGAPTIGTATPGNGRATVTFTAPAVTGGSATTGYTATCNPGGITASGAGSPITVTGLANGTTYACSVTASNAQGTGPASGTASVTPSFNVFSGPSATGSGIITASFTGGGAACAFVSPQFIGAPPGAAPVPPLLPGVAFPHGLFLFSTTGCTPGSTLTFTIVYPSSISNSQYLKYGPTAAQPTPHWYVLPATITGNTAVFTITDGGLGDDDLAANGSVVDQGGPGVGVGVGGGAAAIPTLSQWMLMLLALLIVASAARQRFRPGG